MSRGRVALLAMLAFGCTDVIEHGNPVTLAINMLDCDGSSRASGATQVDITVRSGDDIVFTRVFQLDAMPRTIALPVGTDFAIQIDANDLSGKRIASGSSSTHFAVPATAPIAIDLFQAKRFSRICGTLGTPRARHTATLLADGRVLIVGGEDATGALSSMELITGNEVRQLGPLAINAQTGPLRLPRARHAAVLTSAGQVVISGGEASSATLSTVLVVDPASDFGTGAVGPSVSAALPRSRHAAFEVGGSVFFVGGNSPAAAQEVDRLDLATFKVGPFSSLPEPRLEAAIGQAGTKAVIAGGVDGAIVSARVEVVALDATATPVQLTLATPRRGAQVVTIGQRALVVGGFEANGRANASTEWIGLSDGSVTTGPSVSARGELCAVPMALGRVLLVGGGFDPEVLHADGTIERVSFPGSTRVGQTCTLTESGSVLISGGTEVNGAALGDLWVYTPGN